MSSHVFRGRVWKFGDNVTTDEIIPGRYRFKTDDIGEWAKHVLEGADPEFPKKVRPGDVVVAGKNFGSGSSREPAPLVIKHAGISAVIAKSFARIFFRNAINVGLPVVICEQLPDVTEAGDVVEVDLEKGMVRNLTKSVEFAATKIPNFLMQILMDGGLVEHIRKRGGAVWQDIG